jgi:tetratricopeptide (TPR) repeat protein
MATTVDDESLRQRRDLMLASLAVVREDVPRAKRLVGALDAALPGDRRVTLLDARLAILESREDDAIRMLQPLWAFGAPQDSELVDVSWSLAETLRRRERASEALPILESVLASQSKSSGAPRPDAVVTMIRLANVELSLGLVARALERLREAERPVEQHFGSRSTTYAALQAIKASALSAEEQYLLAADAFLAAADAYAGSLGPSHRNAIRSRFNQAQTLAYVPGREEEALLLYARVEEAARSTMAADDPLLAFMRVEWADALLRSRRWEDARRVLERVVQAPGGGSVAMDRRLAPLVEAIVAGGTGCVSEAIPPASSGERLLKTVCRR